MYMYSIPVKGEGTGERCEQSPEKAGASENATGKMTRREECGMGRARMRSGPTHTGRASLPCWKEDLRSHRFIFAKSDRVTNQPRKKRDDSPRGYVSVSKLVTSERTQDKIPPSGTDRGVVPSVALIS